MTDATDGPHQPPAPATPARRPRRGHYLIGALVVAVLLALGGMIVALWPTTPDAPSTPAPAAETDPARLADVAHSTVVAADSGTEVFASKDPVLAPRPLYVGVGQGTLTISAACAGPGTITIVVISHLQVLGEPSEPETLATMTARCAAAPTVASTRLVANRKPATEVRVTGDADALNRAGYAVRITSTTPAGSDPMLAAKAALGSTPQVRGRTTSTSSVLAPGAGESRSLWMTLKPGEHRLKIACAGTGTLTVRFRVGATEDAPEQQIVNEITREVPCAPAPKAEEFSFGTIDGHPTSVTYRYTTSSTAEGAVAYELRSVG